MRLVISDALIHQNRSRNKQDWNWWKTVQESTKEGEESANVGEENSERSCIR